MNDVAGFSARIPEDITSADLLRECGYRLTNRALWAKFQQRFQRLIFLYVMRAVRSRRSDHDVSDTVTDLAQDVYLRLIQHDGRILRSFRGATEFSVMAFLSRVSFSVVSDQLRRQSADKRSAPVVSFEEKRESRTTVLNATPQILTQILSPQFCPGLMSSGFCRPIRTSAMPGETC